MTSSFAGSVLLEFNYQPAAEGGFHAAPSSSKNVVKLKSSLKKRTSKRNSNSKTGGGGVGGVGVGVLGDCDGDALNSSPSPRVHFAVGDTDIGM